MGTRTDDKCGTGVYTRLVVCSEHPEHDRYEVNKTTCGRRECPICWSTWARRGADRIGCRIDGFRQFDRHPPKHVVLSAKLGELDLVNFEGLAPGKILDRLCAYFTTKAYSVGLTGGAMVVHLWRTADHIPRDTERKKWDIVRAAGAEHFEDNTTWGPHAHIAGYGYLKKPKKGEFLYKNRGYLDTREDVERWAYYALSHGTAMPGKDSVRYFGCCTKSRLKPAWTHRTHTELLCEACGAPMVYEGTNEVHLVVRTEACGWTYTPPRQTVGSDPPKP